MILERGNMWSVFGKTNLFLITTNPIVRTDGTAVMGAGIAKEAATRFPSLPYSFGGQINYWRANRGFVPNILPLGEWEGQSIYSFMVKDHWKEPAKLDIIARSVEDLIRGLRGNLDRRADLNFPGIGNGKLKREDVLPLIEQLPDSVHIWEYE